MDNREWPTGQHTHTGDTGHTGSVMSPSNVRMLHSSFDRRVSVTPLNSEKLKAILQVRAAGSGAARWRQQYVISALGRVGIVIVVVRPQLRWQWRTS